MPRIKNVFTNYRDVITILFFFPIEVKKSSSLLLHGWNLGWFLRNARGSIPEVLTPDCRLVRFLYEIPEATDRGAQHRLNSEGKISRIERIFTKEKAPQKWRLVGFIGMPVFLLEGVDHLIAVWLVSFTGLLLPQTGVYQQLVVNNVAPNES